MKLGLCTIFLLLAATQVAYGDGNIEITLKSFQDLSPKSLNGFDCAASNTSCDYKITICFMRSTCEEIDRFRANSTNNTNFFSSTDKVSFNFTGAWKKDFSLKITINRFFGNTNESHGVLNYSNKSANIAENSPIVLQNVTAKLTLQWIVLCSENYYRRDCSGRCPLASNSSLCQNGGNCSFYGNNNTCLCPVGFTGSRCEISDEPPTSVSGSGSASGDIDDACAPFPCQNNGSCIEKYSNFTCVCISGYTGDFCEFFSFCASNPCQHNSTCVDHVNDTYACTCPDEYTGRNCETVVFKLCDSNPCLNNASCNESDVGYNCTCLEGFTGLSCESNISDCLPDSCSNGGTCLDETNGYTCVCSEGFSGVNCSVNLNECDSLPCYNSATCEDEINGYTCLCLPGYTGSDCIVEIDECIPNPCRNDGNCNDTVAMYVCDCKDGFTGSNCEISINECMSSPCLNSGTCFDYEAGYSCSCLRGFTGTLCETELKSSTTPPPTVSTKNVTVASATTTSSLFVNGTVFSENGTTLPLFTTEPSEGESAGLGPGAIAGVSIVGLLLVAAVVIVIVYFLVIRPKKKTYPVNIEKKKDKRSIERGKPEKESSL